MWTLEFVYYVFGYVTHRIRWVGGFRWLDYQEIGYCSSGSALEKEFSYLLIKIWHRHNLLLWNFKYTAKGRRTFCVYTQALFDYNFDVWFDFALFEFVKVFHGSGRTLIEIVKFWINFARKVWRKNWLVSVNWRVTRTPYQ